MRTIRSELAIARRLFENGVSMLYLLTYILKSLYRYMLLRFICALFQPQEKPLFPAEHLTNRNLSVSRREPQVENS